MPHDGIRGGDLCVRFRDKDDLLYLQIAILSWLWESSDPRVAA